MENGCVPVCRDGRDAVLYAVKNYRWIWIAIDRLAKQYISFVCGDRNSHTEARLRDKIVELTVGQFFSDHWKAYAELFPKDKLKQTKAETFSIEGYNCKVRHYFARFKRKDL